MSNCFQTPVRPFEDRHFLLISHTLTDINPVARFSLLLLRNPGNKLPGPPAIPSSNVPKELLQGFQLDLTATRGNSGGPVFSLRSGKVFGVLQGGIQKAQGYMIAQPILPIAEGHALNEILNKHKDIPRE